MRGVARAAWRRLVSLVGPHRCGSCGKPLRALGSTDLSPEAVRAYRLAGTLGRLLAAAYVCDDCTKPGGWVLIE